MAQHVNLPMYQEFIIVDDPSVATKWEDWIEGLEALMKAMVITDEEHMIPAAA